MKQGWSLRRRLLAALVALAAALFAISATQSYLAYRKASDRLFDDSLRESAGLILQLVQHEIAEHGQMLGVALLNAEVQPGPYAFRFQVWTRDMQAGYLSSGGPAMPFVDFDHDGLTWSDVDGETWRTLALWNDQRTLQVQIAQRKQVRVELQHQALVRTAISFAALLALATALIWWIVGASIRPLRETAVSVGRRNEQDLRPVDTGSSPREARPLLDALNRLLERVSATLASERRFTADAAHELRTPLAAIRANAQVLLGARDAAERDQTARDLLASVDRGTRLVDQLLALARADQSVAPERFRVQDLASVAADQLRQHASQAKGRNIRLESELAPAMMRGDAALLAVMIRNLLDNALRYGPEGSQIRVATRVVGDQVELRVEDQGSGIPPEERQRVFERFHRLAGSRASGSGLGLSIVLRIVEQHGGSVVIEDAAGGQGTRVRVSFARVDSGQSGDLAGEGAE